MEAIALHLCIAIVQFMRLDPFHQLLINLSCMCRCYEMGSTLDDEQFCILVTDGRHCPLVILAVEGILWSAIIQIK